MTAWANLQSRQGNNSASKAAFSQQNEAAPEGFMVVKAALYSILRSQNQGKKRHVYQNESDTECISGRSVIRRLLYPVLKKRFVSL